MLKKLDQIPMPSSAAEAQQGLWQGPIDDGRWALVYENERDFLSAPRSFTVIESQALDSWAMEFHWPWREMMHFLQQNFDVESEQLDKELTAGLYQILDSEMTQERDQQHLVWLSEQGCHHWLCHDFQVETPLFASGAAQAMGQFLAQKSL